jgi:hypothetical protein
MDARVLILRFGIVGFSLRCLLNGFPVHLVILFHTSGMMGGKKDPDVRPPSECPPMVAPKGLQHRNQILAFGLMRVKVVSVAWLRSRIGFFFCSLALLQLLGGHWTVLQLGAWASMMVKYSQHAGLISGISQTLDGEHPCPICKAIQDGKKQEEKKAPLLNAELKKDYLANWNYFQIHQEWTEFAYPGFSQQLEVLTIEPAVPPPRA